MVRRPKLLDLYCKAGGASVGYFLAGFDVTGVDIEPQPRYPFPFIQSNALTIDLEGYDAYHASPPCQKYSRLKAFCKSSHPEHIESIRQRLMATGRPYIIENVPCSPLINYVRLNGTMFGLGVIRERWFESNVGLLVPTNKSPHRGETLSGQYVTVAGQGSRKIPGEDYTLWGVAMATSWMTKQELTQAIPWLYTLYLGSQLKRQCQET